MEIVNVTADTYREVEDFLKTVKGVKIDVDVIMNASMALDQGEIKGIISFECFGNIGLIRYFIFKQILDETIIKSLFNSLRMTASSKGINKIIAYISNVDTIPIFDFLGFKQSLIQNIYIEEEKYKEITAKDPIIYEYVIN